MRVISALKELSSFVFSINIEEKSIGFVPTMGALHKGHLSLIRRSIEENNVTIVSIFVNPLQFNDSKDLEKYPRTLREDLDLLRNLSVDIVFTPSEKDFYNTKPLVSINFGGMAQRLEGKFRKGHFEGVGVVVSKLLHLAMPSKAYFGLKDLQQYLLIKQMCQDLSFPCEIVGVETEREPSGLALSSRNRRLSTEGLEVASNIYKGLTIIEEGIRLEKSLESLLSKAKLIYDGTEGLKLEYLEAINPQNLSVVDNYYDLDELAICVAGYVEGIRLIDNLYLRLKIKGHVHRGTQIENSQG